MIFGSFFDQKKSTTRFVDGNFHETVIIGTQILGSDLPIRFLSKDTTETDKKHRSFSMKTRDFS